MERLESEIRGRKCFYPSVCSTATTMQPLPSSNEPANDEQKEE
jgi:hypothetical protein